MSSPPRRRVGSAVLCLGWAGTATGVCAALIALWIATGNSAQAQTMIWNLGLAWIPVVAAALGLMVARHRGRGAWLLPAGILWLAVLPNAPYLATDIVHVHEFTSSVPLLIPAVLVALGATGVILFWASVTIACEVVRESGQRPAGRVVVPACMAAAAIGIYIGRELRWNSWDLVTRPRVRLQEALRVVAAPGALLHAAGITLVAMGLCWGAYVLVGRLAHLRRT
jgi:uncharacterized membrane protein